MTGVTVNEAGIFVLEELDEDTLNDLLNNTRERGIYKPVVTDFLATGEVYTVASAHPKLRGKGQSAIVQSLKNVIKNDNDLKHACKVAKKGDHTLLVNIAAHAAAVEAKAAQQ